MGAELYPDLMDGGGALACPPVEGRGRNWLARRTAAIRHDPDWHNGCYEQNPHHDIYSAAGTGTTASPTRIQAMAPPLAAANALYERRLAEAAQGDTNNQLWAIEAIQDDNPEPDLDQITATGLLLHDAEDHANPPALGPVERAMQRVTHGRSGLLPAGPDTHGPCSHDYARLWKPSLLEFLAPLGPEQTGAVTVAHERRGCRARRGVDAPRSPARYAPYTLGIYSSRRPRPGRGVAIFITPSMAHRAAWLVLTTGFWNCCSQAAMKRRVGKFPPGTTRASISGLSMRVNAAVA
jgi:hypothetical protein